MLFATTLSRQGDLLRSSTMHVLSLNLQRGGGINASAYGACLCLTAMLLAGGSVAVSRALLLSTTPTILDRGKERCIDYDTSVEKEREIEDVKRMDRWLWWAWDPVRIAISSLYMAPRFSPAFVLLPPPPLSYVRVPR